MPDRTWPLYDTAVFGTTAATLHSLFQVRENADATHITGFTNMRGNGQMPSNESYMIRGVRVFPDVLLDPQDVELVWRASYLRIRVADREMFVAPLIMCAGNAAFGGVLAQGTVTDEALIGPHGDGFMIDEPIAIVPGGNLMVEVFQATALNNAAQNIKVVLDGILTRP